MDFNRTAAAPTARARFRWLAHFSIVGDLRFISHHDTLRMFRRAMARADLPLRFSEGFNPHPRLNLPLPRPVGVSSEAETFLFETDRDIDPAEALSRLQRQLPQGVEMGDMTAWEGGTPSPEEARYQLIFEGERPLNLPDRVREFVESTDVQVERRSPKERIPKRVNVRPFVGEIFLHDHFLEFTVRMNGAGSARPAEIAAALGLRPEETPYRIHRLEVRWRS